jgi:diaminohydroxyphosphoribosylaminopyrimidine deaminase / 5-amino-6-(5-phosphoribosylamino)uracil reductase
MSRALDEKFMRLALREAERGIGWTSPNPAVGAVIVKDDRVLSKAWHRRAGEPHAEIEALRALRKPELAHRATLYVTLEPCCTHGRTPPCTDAIISAGFRRVVFGATDPNPLHAGYAITILKRAGIEVTHGVLRDECMALNAGFNKWITKGLPLVIAKAGLSVDGRLTRPPAEGQWLTSESSRMDAMRLRAHVDAILIGAGTLRADNPKLTVRGVPGYEEKQPLRVVITRNGHLPKDACVFNDAHRMRTLVYRAKPLRHVLHDLGRRGCTSVLIEGGGELLGSAFDARLVDRVHFYVAPLLCGGPTVIGGRGVGSTAESVSLANVSYSRIGPDLRITGDVAPAPEDRGKPSRSPVSGYRVPAAASAST